MVINTNILFFLAILIFAIFLRLFYYVQRKLFAPTYYSFQELIIGLPRNLTWAQVFLVKFLPPLIAGFFAFSLLSNLFQKELIYYALVGGISALINILPALRVAFWEKPEDISAASLLTIYLLYLLSFSLLSLLGAHLASGFKGSFSDFLPSRQGVLDGIWAAVIILILKKLNEPIS